MPPRLRLGTPIWLRSSSPLSFPALTRRATADVAVVGGGITGAIVAWRFARAGARVVVLESHRVGHGSTAASTALLMQEPDEDFARLSARYGRRRTKRIWELARDATANLVRSIGTLDIDCDLTRRDSIYYARGEDAGERLRREYRHRRNADLGGRWLDAAALRRAANIEGGVAIRTQGNAQVDPFKTCVGFAQAAAKLGARIYERSPVERIQASRRHVTVETRRGAVDADRVIVATGYATPYFEPLAARFKMLQTYVAATAPLRQRDRDRIGLGPVMLWDAARPYHYARWSADSRLVLGGGDRPRISGRRRERAVRTGVADIRRFFVDVYPALEHVPFEYAWEGLFATTPDGLPYIGPHRRYPGHLFALGYGGNGMTFAYLAAEFLLQWHLGDRSEDHDLFAFGRMR